MEQSKGSDEPRNTLIDKVVSDRAKTGTEDKIPRAKAPIKASISEIELQNFMDDLRNANNLPQLGFIKDRDIKILLRAEIYARAHPSPIAKWIPKYYLKLLLGRDGARTREIINLLTGILGEGSTTVIYEKERIRDKVKSLVPRRRK